MPSPEERRRRTPRTLWDEEPLATMRAFPRRFAVGVPVVFGVAIGAGLLLAERSLSLALAALLLLQTAGLLGLYLPALRRSLREGGRDSGEATLGEDRSGE
jgi:hypothetical protein